MGVFVLLALLLHRPVILYGVPYAASYFLRGMGMDASFSLSGSLFTSLTIENLSIKAQPGKPADIQSIKLGRAHLVYDLWAAIKGRLGDAVQIVEVQDFDGLITPRKPDPNKPKKPRAKRTVSARIHDLFSPKIPLPNRLAVERVNLRITSEKSDIRLEGISIVIDSQKPGVLQAALVSIPGAGEWRDIDATTSFENRNLRVRGIVLRDQIALEELHLDQSERMAGKGSLSVKLTASGGALGVSLQSRLSAGVAPETSVNLTASDLPISEILTGFGIKGVPVKWVRSLSIAVQGPPDVPAKWGAKVQIHLEGIGSRSWEGPSAQPIAESFSLEGAVTPGSPVALNAKLLAGPNTVDLAIQGMLPESHKGWLMIDATAQASVDVKTPEGLVPSSLKPAGQGTLQGDLSMHGGIARADLQIATKGLSIASANVATSALKISAEQQLSPKPNFPGEGRRARVEAQLSGIEYGSQRADKIDLQVGMKETSATVEQLVVRRGENTVQLQGQASMPTAGEKWKAEGKLAIDIPRLAEFGLKLPPRKTVKTEATPVVVAPPTDTKTPDVIVAAAPDAAPPEPDTLASGEIRGSATYFMQGDLKNLRAAVELEGKQLALGEFKTTSLIVKARQQGTRTDVEELQLTVAPGNSLKIKGAYDMQDLKTYEGDILLGIDNAAVFDPLLRVLGLNKTLAGKLSLHWNGHGWLAPPTHRGDVELKAQDVRFDKTKVANAVLEGSYREDSAETSALQVEVGSTKVSGALEWIAERAKIGDLVVEQGGQTALSGFIVIPFNLSDPKKPVDLDDRIAANLTAKDLDVERLITSFGLESPAKGRISAQVLAAGSVSKPAIDVKIGIRQASANAAPKAAKPTDADLDLHLENNEAVLKATVRNPDIQPLTIAARLPLDVGTIIRTRKMNTDLPLDVDVKLPASSLAVIPAFVPAVRRIDGTVGLDLKIRGSVQKPELDGKLALDLRSARLKADAAPSFGETKAAIDFSLQSVTIQNFRGEIGGGTFELGGKITLPKLTEPVFDLSIKTDDMLVFRNESVTVRIDSDLKIAGPLKAGSAKGAIYVTQSRFLKDIDILPFALLQRSGRTERRSAPVAVSGGVPGGPISLPEPFKAWTFDIGLRTRPGEAFLVRGNLANGAVSLDMKLAGTGAAPVMDGSAVIDSFKASLPYSTLTTTSGVVYFLRDRPFVAQFDIHSESRIRDYVVSATIYGSSESPQIALSSEPPLPYSDIVSLVATGTTTAELGSNAEVLASRAAVLAVQELYRKIFRRRKTGAPATTAGTNAEDSQNFFERFQVDLGAIDSRTGRQEVVSRFRVNDSTYLVGELDTEGQFNGQLQYLIRFR